jgi:hypothetical protein
VAVGEPFSISAHARHRSTSSLHRVRGRRGEFEPSGTAEKLLGGRLRSRSRY